MGRLWQAAGTVASVLRPRLLEKAAACGLRSLFVGFETLDADNLRAQQKPHNLRRDYGEAIRRLHGLGVMVNGSFVFGMDADDDGVFGRTVEWAVGQGIETATFHILTPYPGTVTFQQMEAQGRILHRDWDLYDTRHVVFRPARLRAEALEAGYWRAYRDFYGWRNIVRGAATKPTLGGALRHAAYAAGWKKFEPLWDWLIRARRVGRALPVLESVLQGFTRGPRRPASARSDQGAEDLVRDERAAVERDQPGLEGIGEGEPEFLEGIDAVAAAEGRDVDAARAAQPGEQRLRPAR